MRRLPIAAAVAAVVAAVVTLPPDLTTAGGASADYIVRYTAAAVTSAVPGTRNATRVRPSRTGRRVDRAKVDRRIGAARSLGIKPTRIFRHAIGGFSARLTAAQVRRLRADPAVAAVEIDAVISIEDDLVEGSVVSTTNVSPQRMPTGLRRIYADKQPLAHIGSGKTTNADIAVIDTGIATHPDLRIAGGVNCTSKGGTNYQDRHGHGTHVAGIIGARDNGVGVVGVVPGARLWAIKSLGDDGRGTTAELICGLDWMIGQQLSASGPAFLAANMSIAGPLDFPNRPCSRGTEDTSHLLMCAAMDAGIVFAVAAANDHRVVNKQPAIYDEPITVGALADFDGKPGGKGRQADVCPWYSSDVDDTYADFSNWGKAVDLIAPGKCILSTYPGNRYAWMSGTSMATPYVAGAIALYRMRYPDAKPQQVKQALVSAGTRDWRTGTAPDGRAYRLLQVKTLRTPPTFSLTASDAFVGLAGSRSEVTVSISRKSGHYRPITITATSTPVGIDADTLTIGEGTTTRRLVLHGSDDLVADPYTVRLVATDGELSATTSITVRTDAAAPKVTLTSPKAGSTIHSAGSIFRVSATSSDADSGIGKRTLQRKKAAPSGRMSCADVTFTNDGAAVTVTGSGPWTSAGLKSATCYRWVLTVIDKAGNSTLRRSGPVWVDASPPEAPTIKTPGDGVVRGSTVWLAGGSAGRFTLSAITRDPHSGIEQLSISTVSGGGWTATTKSSSAAVDARTASVTRTFSFTKGSGSSSVSITAVNGVGARTVTRVSFKRDTDAPTITVASPTKQTWLGSASVTIRFKARDSGAGIGSVSVARQRAPLRSKSAGCSKVTWTADGKASVVTGDTLTAKGLQRDTCYRWVITATDRLGLKRSKTTSPVAIDPTRPVVAQVKVAVAKQRVSTSGAIPVTASWALVTAPVGATSYEVARTTDGGTSWQRLGRGTATTTSAATSLVSGRATTLSVRARSTTGAVSTWATSPRMTARLVQEGASAVSRSTGWTHVRLDSASGGRRLESTKQGATVTYRFTGTSIALMAARGKQLGSATIRIDGKQVATVRLTAASTTNRQVVWRKALTSGEHAITVVVKSGRVVVDGFVVTRTAKGDGR